MSRSIQDYDADTAIESWNIRDYDSVTDNLSRVKFYEDLDDFNVKVAEREGEILGYVAYGQEDGKGVLDLIEVMDEFKGLRNGDRTVSKDLAEYAFNELENKHSAVVLHAKALEGPVQSLAESHGYEVSGFQPEVLVSNGEENSGEGFTAELWKFDEGLRPYTIDAYLSPEVSEAAEASLPNQSEINYLEPHEIATGDFSYTGKKRVGPKAVNATLEDGGKSPESIAEELALMAVEDNRSWIYSVDLDVEKPASYRISEGLSERGWSLINVSPDLESGGATATMVKQNDNAGSYNFTPRTMNFVEATGLPFRVDEEGERSNKVTFNPADPEVDVEAASEDEIDEFYQKIKASD